MAGSTDNAAMQTLAGGERLAAAEFVAGLELRSPRETRRPRVVAIMIASVDGRATVDGRAGGLGHPADRALMRALRAEADAMYVGSRTLAIEGYGNLLDQPDRDVRVAAGRDPVPLVVTISRDLRLPAGAAVFSDPHTSVLVYTDAAEAAVVPEVGAALEVERIGDAVELTPGVVLAGLADRGIEVVVCEGGPALLGLLVAEGCVDDLLLTVSPMLVGDGAPVLRLPVALDPPVPCELASVHRADSHLFLHYRLGS